MIMKKTGGDYFNFYHIVLPLSLVTLILKYFWICRNLQYGEAHIISVILDSYTVLYVKK